MGNADVSQVNLTVTDGNLGASVGASSQLICIAGCTASGTALSPKQYSKASALVTDFGYGPAVERAAHHIERTGRPVWFVRLASNTAGSAYSVVTSGVTGGSVITATGTPLDRYEIKFEVVTGGTIGTTGIVFKYSLDGGRHYSSKVSLGTANSFLLPNTGVTLAFAAGTLVAADVATLNTEAPKWTSSDFAALFTALAAQSQLFGMLQIVGEAAKTDLDALETQLQAYKNSSKRFIQAMTETRQRYRDCAMTGNPNLTFADADPDTITRATGSWITDGFKVGMSITVDSASNDGTYEIASLTATVITLVAGDALSAEGPTNGHTVTGTESKTKYQSLLRTEFDSFTSEDGRVATGAGGVFTPTVIHPVAWDFRRSPAWHAGVRHYQFGISASLGAIEDGRLVGASITDANNNLVEWDSRVDTGLASKDGSNGRFITVQTHDGISGVFISTPSTMHSAGSDFSRVHLTAIMSLACQTVHATMTRELQSKVILNSSGFIRESRAKDIEGSVRQQLEVALLRDEHASDAYLSLTRNDALATPGTDLTGKVTVVPPGYVEGVSFEMAFGNPALDA